MRYKTPKEYLRYKYKYILNNYLYHALLMFDSTLWASYIFTIDWYVHRMILQIQKVSN